MAVKPGNLGYTFTDEQRKKVSDGVRRKLKDINYKNKRTESILKYIRSEKGRKQRKKINYRIMEK